MPVRRAVGERPAAIDVAALRVRVELARSHVFDHTLTQSAPRPSADGAALSGGRGLGELPHPRRAKKLDGLEGWLAERFRRHAIPGFGRRRSP